MSQVFTYRSWVKLLPTDRDWARCVGHITLQVDANNQELYHSAVKDILKKWNEKTMLIYGLEITKEDAN